MTKSSERKVMIAVDGSEYSTNAIEWFKNQDFQEGDEIILVHVRPSRVMPSVRFPQTDQKDSWTLREEQEVLHSKTILEEATRTFSDSTKVSQTILVGDPREELELLIKKLSPTVVIMGSTGKTGLKRMIGSVTDYIIHHSACPVLVYRKPQPHA
ncbi:hypothetical protein BC833DRAFT_579699 [Globomyces pollinis-pini]|nr:hypothetical protein BC833DRAFT_579699 [Globomyces pollinis-pini]KAJ2994235.1 hypothetical protein HDV02_001737 [Globomyces sp. JEL0801]